MRFVDQFKALVFDMNGTFMFDHDRLGSDQDFFSTYPRLGGNGLDEPSVRAAVLETCTQLRRDYDDPAHFDAFPQLLDAVVPYAKLCGPQAHTIAAVIAEHEVGTIPEWAAETLRMLSTTHPLALVSNVWAPAPCWDAEFNRSGVAGTFKHCIFSSTIGAIQPSPRPFVAALQAHGVSAKDALFIGDDIQRDVLPAQRLGMHTALISEDTAMGQADVTVPSIRQLQKLGMPVGAKPPRAP